MGTSLWREETHYGQSEMCNMREGNRLWIQRRQVVPQMPDMVVLQLRWTREEAVPQVQTGNVEVDVPNY
jgi:hypothetical protein